jgi:membrane protease subunit (stomatin/prohibitin family)
MLPDAGKGLTWLTAAGTFDLRIADAEKIIKKISNAQISYSTEDARKLVNNMMLNLLPDALAQSKFSLLDAGEDHPEIAAFIEESINTEFNSYGLMLKKLTIKLKALRAEN